MPVFAATFSFLIGSIPFAVICSRVVGVDVRVVGSGNPGFINTVRAIGLVRALPVLVGDIGKGWCGAYVALVLGGGWWAAIFVVVGHCFSPWLHFRGGKGVAAFIGISLFANPVIGIGGMLTWVVIGLLFRIASLASLISIVCILFLIARFEPDAFAPFIAAAALIALRHLENMRRLLRGSEARIV